MDQYRTVARTSTVEYRIERSVFIGHAAPVASEDEARQFVARIREEHRQANHNPFAYVVGLEPEPVSYYHDHGEPGGTAGKPILGAITRLDLTNTVVVVTRYFGGKKLGVRGLIEAYGGTATLAVEAAKPLVQTRMAGMKMVLDYGSVNQVLYILEQQGAELLGRDFSERVELTVRIAVSAATALKNALEPHVRSIVLTGDSC